MSRSIDQGQREFVEAQVHATLKTLSMGQEPSQALIDRCRKVLVPIVADLVGVQDKVIYPEVPESVMIHFEFDLEFVKGQKGGRYTKAELKKLAKERADRLFRRIEEDAEDMSFELVGGGFAEVNDGQETS